jgi:hypothetical protein
MGIYIVFRIIRPSQCGFRNRGDQVKVEDKQLTNLLVTHTREAEKLMDLLNPLYDTEAEFTQAAQF